MRILATALLPSRQEPSQLENEKATRLPDKHRPNISHPGGIKSESAFHWAGRGSASTKPALQSEQSTPGRQCEGLFYNLPVVYTYPFEMSRDLVKTGIYKKKDGLSGKTQRIV
jgi:hypothetical protein